MQKIVRQVLLHIGIGLLVFLCAILFFNYRISREKGNPVSEMSNSSYPVMEIGTKQGNYNVMSAYNGNIDLSLVRNQIAVTEEDNSLELRLHDYDYDITAIRYVLFEKTEKEPLEEGTLNKLKKNTSENVKTVVLKFENNIQQDKSYYLKMTIRLDNSTQVSFYSKIQNASGYHLADYLKFAGEFHKNLFSKTNMEKNVSYLEPSQDENDNNLFYVDIHSSIDTVSFGNATFKQVADPIVKVKEINSVYALIQLNSILSTEVSDGVIQYYDVQEIYKMRYTSQRMYLLDYQRTMGAYYNEKIFDSAKNYITLGIQDKNNVSIFSTDDGKKVCFIEEGQLWYYNYNSSDVAKVFSFSSENVADLRNNQEEHGIKLLSMDEKGNIYYLVYGYMNRGHYEGENGILILKYNAQDNCSEEQAFLSTSIPYERMKEDVEKFTYLNSDKKFYCLLDGDLHTVDLNTKKDNIIETQLVNESITASKDQSIIAIERSRNTCKNREIDMINLESGQKHTFTCKKDQRIRAVGFLSNDFIYGIAQEEHVKKQDNGAIIFPISRLSISKMDGKEVKSYYKNNFYIMDTKIVGSVLEMNFAKKKNSKFVAVNEKDYIRYKENEEKGQATLTYDYSATYGNRLYIRFPEYVYIQIQPDLVLTKVLISDNNMLIPLERSGKNKKQYYVYSEGKEQAVYSNLMEAVKTAAEIRGSVINSQEQTVWESAYAEYAMVAGMDKIVKANSDKQSLSACMAMISIVNGKHIRAGDIEIDSGAETIEEQMKKYSNQEAINLTGCTVDEVLYYISKGNPILTKYSKTRYIILMSYNSSKVRYLDPVTGKSTVMDRSAFTDTIAKNGDVFYSYLTK